MTSLLLLSGGLDSAVLLGYILSLGKKCMTLSFDYGQRHRDELLQAQFLATHYNVEHHTISIDPKLFSSASSSLTNKALPVSSSNAYVPARNLLFLAHAVSFAEAREITEIYFGVNQEDAPFFPDCRKDFFHALSQAVSLGTKNSPSILTPFSSFSKKEIIALGKSLAVPMDMTLSCYDPQQGKLCGKCHSCLLRGDLKK
jgi:7-cyano-7-deazaguanine synthase